MLEKLLSHLYSALNKAPNPVICLRVNHPDGFAWSVDGGTLTASTEAGDSLGVFNLSDYTLTGLAEALQAAGCSIIYENHDVNHRSAAALMAGAGKQSASNGDCLQVFDSLLWSILDAYSLELDEASDNVDQAVNQLYLDSADGLWLDFWGEYFGLRRGTRTDAEYRKYLIDETLRPRSNKFAILKAVQDLTGETIDIYEPWNDMFVLGVSKMNDKDHFQDGEYYAYNVIHPSSVEPIKWDQVIPVVKHNKPAGVVSVAPKTSFRPRGIDAQVQSDTTIFAEHRQHGGSVFSAGDAVLDVMVLSGDSSIKSHRASIFQVLADTNEVGLYNDNYIQKPREVAKAAVCLSDGMVLGEINTLLGRGKAYLEEDFGTLSGSTDATGVSLSDGVFTLRRFPIEEIIDGAKKSEVAHPDVWKRIERGIHLLKVSDVLRMKTESLGWMKLSDWENNRTQTGSNLSQFADWTVTGYELGGYLRFGQQEQIGNADLGDTTQIRYGNEWDQVVSCDGSEHSAGMTRIMPFGYETEPLGTFEVTHNGLNLMIGDALAHYEQGYVETGAEQRYGSRCTRLPDSEYWLGGWDSRLWRGATGNFLIAHHSA